MKCLLFFSDFLLSNEMSGYPENKSTIIFFVSILLLSYEPDKIRQNNMDHPVYSFSDMKPVHFYRDSHLTSDCDTYFYPHKKKFG